MRIKKIVQSNICKLTIQKSNIDNQSFKNSSLIKKDELLKKQKNQYTSKFTETEDEWLNTMSAKHSYKN